MCNCNGMQRAYLTMMLVGGIANSINAAKGNKNNKTDINTSVFHQMGMGYGLGMPYDMGMGMGGFSPHMMNMSMSGMPYSMGMLGCGMPGMYSFMPGMTDFSSNLLDLDYTGLSSSVTGTSTKNKKSTPALKAWEKMEENIKKLLGSKKDLSENTDKEKGVDLTGDAWRESVIDGDAQTDAKYKELVKKFGKDFIKGIDAKYGNGDNTLDIDEYKKFELGSFDESEFTKDEKDEFNQGCQLAFDKLDLNNDQKLDEKEISMLLAAMDRNDQDTENGRITINDYNRISEKLKLDKDSQESKDFVSYLRGIYSHLFGTES